MKITSNDKGFTLVLGLILVALVAGVIAVVGYIAWQQHQAKPTTQSSAYTPPPKSKAPKATSTNKTVALGSASYKFDLPNGWAYKDVSVLDVDQENLIYVTEPTGKLQLELQIISKSLTSGPPGANETLGNSFKGIKGKTYYLNGYRGNSKVTDGYELIHITACSDKHCYTELNKDFDLNLSIRAAYTENAPVNPVKLTDPIIKDIETVIQSIQF